MLDFLKAHPFAVEARFDSSLVVTFAAPAGRIRKLIPECLNVDELRGNGFIAVAMVQTRELRPAGFPEFLGQDFFLIGYRVFVRFTDATGRSMRGLYILRSATNKRRMQISGNFFTRYAYRTIDVVSKEVDGVTTIASRASDLDVAYKEASDTVEVGLPHGSPFATLQEARKFAGPLPYTFTVEPERKRVLIIEGVRENWRPQAVEIINAQVGFLEELGLGNAILANAFMVRDIPYRWEKGRYAPLT